MTFFLLWNTDEDILNCFCTYKSMDSKTKLDPTDFHCKTKTLRITWGWVNYEIKEINKKTWSSWRAGPEFLQSGRLIICCYLSILLSIAAFNFVFENQTYEWTWGVKIISLSLYMTLQDYVFCIYMYFVSFSVKAHCCSGGTAGTF